nr:cytochrome b/b6 domain-containing protein [uncultured Halomonas sp.]
MTLRDRRIKVWDPIVRVFHWTVALGVIANLTVLEHVKTPHIYVGYVVVAALFIRLVWGVVARNHARFSSFVPGPRGLFAYLKLLVGRREPRYVGHNPAGAVMMVALMLLVLVVGITGWMMGLDHFWGVRWVETTHEVIANLILGAAILHVLGAIIESLRHRENLPWSMVTGYKRATKGTDVDRAPPANRR